MDKLRAIKKKIKKSFLFFDGGMGTYLQKMGLASGACPDEWNLVQPEKVLEAHKSYIGAGSDFITTNTFGGNRIKLSEYGLEDKIREINGAGTALGMRAAEGTGVLVAGDIGPTGKIFEPHGKLTFDEAAEVFGEQARILESAGADIIIIETMSDLAELRAAVIGVKEYTKLPFIAQMSFSESGMSLHGDSPAATAATLSAFEPFALGVNCGMGPDRMGGIVEQFALHTDHPVILQPNAGVPELINNQTVFRLRADKFAEQTVEAALRGACIVGGCCGSTPEHIRRLRNGLDGKTPVQFQVEKGLRLSSRSLVRTITPESPLTVIGERINPTGKKRLTLELKAKKTGWMQTSARRQKAAGAHVLDVNVAVPGINEPEAMKLAVEALQSAVNVPLALDSNDPQVLENGLKYYTGRALVNSVSAESVRMQEILPLMKKYGAAGVGLAMSEKGTPETARERISSIEKIMRCASDHNLDIYDFLFDCLVFTAGAQPEQPNECLKALEIITAKMKALSLLGISNVAHGLPRREWIVASFLSMALQKGLNAAITNILQPEIAAAVKAGNLLMNRDTGAAEYIRYASQMMPAHGAIAEKAIPERKAISDASNLFTLMKNGVINGDKDKIEELLNRVLMQGVKPFRVIDEIIVPALEEVGRLFENGTYFLPQLIMAGETAQKAFNILKNSMDSTEQAAKKYGKIILASVQGDVHDIGKRIVATVLQNHGYDIVDLGKSVPTNTIIETVLNEKPQAVGLSALMTTTLSAMEDAVLMLREHCPEVKIMVGGAVVTQQYADKIGAHLYGEDAVQAARKIGILLKTRA